MLLFEESLLTSSFAWSPWVSPCIALTTTWAEREVGSSGIGWVSHGSCRKEHFVTFAQRTSTTFMALRLQQPKKQDSMCHLIKAFRVVRGTALSLNTALLTLPCLGSSRSTSALSQLLHSLHSQQKEDGHLQSVVLPIPTCTPKTRRRIAFYMRWHPLQVLRRNFEGPAWTRCPTFRR